MSGNIINLLDSDSDNNTSVEQIFSKKHPPIHSASENADAQQESEKENQTPQGINMGTNNSSKNTKRGLKPALLSLSRSSGAHLHSDDDSDLESPVK
jgi:hypothetical protein